MAFWGVRTGRGGSVRRFWTGGLEKELEQEQEQELEQEQVQDTLTRGCLKVHG